MKVTALSCLALWLCVAAACWAESTEDIILLAQKGVGEDVLLATIEKSKDAYQLSAADILKLKDAKVPDKVIAAMIRHRSAGGEVAVGQARELAPVAPRPAPAVKEAPLQEEARAEGVLNIENVDDKIWSYAYEPDEKTIWISTPTRDGRGNLQANGGLSVRLPADTYKIRYNGEESGPEVSVLPGEKSSILITRVDTTELEALYVTVFEKGTRKGGGRIVTLRQSAPAKKVLRESTRRDARDSELETTERVVERERVVEVPRTTVIYRDTYVPPAVIYAPPPVYHPGYYAPCSPSHYYPHRSSYFRFGYGSGYRQSGFSIGIGGRF